MRTRFLTPNYFTPVTAAETLGFLRFPLSPLSAASASVATSTVDFYDELLRSAVDSVSCAVDLHLDNLPVDEDALSNFYADVLPHTIDVDNDGFPVNVGASSGIVDVPEVRQTIDVDYDDCSVDAGVNRGNVHFPESESYSCCTKNPSQSCSTSYSESLDNQFSEESKEATGGDKIQNRPVIVQFEIPELSLDVENACLSEKEKNLFLSEGHAHDDNLELLNLIPMDQFDLDFKEVVNSVETICQEYDLAEKLPIPEDIDLLPKNSHPCESCDTVFPLLEVDETGAVDFTRFCVEDEWHSLVVTMEEHHSASHDDLELSCQNLLVSVNTDILEQISGCHTSKLHLEFCLTSLNLTVDADFLQLIEDPYTESNIWTEDSFPIPFLMSIQFEEFKMFDPDPFDIFDALAVPQTDKEPKTCDQLLNSNQLSKSFDELIVSPELAIIDGTFTSLPVPTLVDDEKTWSVETIVDTVLAELEQLPFSTSDEIYLDWYLLGSDKYSGHLNTEIEKIFSDIDDYTIKTNLEPSDCGIVLLEFLLSEYSLDKVDAIEDKLDMPSEQSFTDNQRVNHTATKRLLDIDDCQFMGSRVKVPEADVRKVASSNLFDDDDCQIIENYQLLRDGEHGKVASSQLMPQVNDLDFFLNPRKAASGMRTDQRLRPQVANFMLSGGPNKKAVAEAVPSSSINIQKFNIQLHRVMLSDNILILIDNLRRTYLAMIRQDTQLSMTKSAVTDSDDMNLLRIPEHTLMDHMNRSSKQKSCMGHRDDKDVIFITLCAIKRMAWCLCIYGIYNLHIFLCKLFESLPFLKSRLFSIYTLVEDAKSIVDKELTKSHPSLTIIKEILRQYSNRSRKILILAQPDSWRSLKRLLSSMNISCVEVDLLTHGYQSDPSYDLFAGGGKDHTQTACALVKHKHISPSILTQKIDLIIECGGPCGVSKLSALHSEHIGSQNLHFVKIELDDVARALCEGVNVTSSDTDTIQLEGLLNFGPLVESSNIASAASAGGKCDSLSLPVCQIAQESEAVQACDTSFPDLVIIVNTENFEKEMIISRRGTYQKILSMEKRGVQVVERDLMLPIDIILDAVTCIVWYDSKNIGKKSSAEDEGSSSVPLCIENIATNVLTSLSFTFTASVLVFEGDSNFLGTVMESADELYAAAASLGIKIQILYSYSFELTDEIILNYIGRARNECKGSLPTLPETETNIEYFLTRFPSINPLSAHAIISCGCMLLEYLEWSNDCRIHELRKYNLPEESINLLSILLKYGEREETKSGLTDCSSSMSSPPDSEKFTCKVNSVDRKRKLIPKSSDTMHGYKGIMTSDKCIEELDYFESPSDSKVPKSPRISLQKKLPGFVMDEEVFGDRDRPRASASMNPSKAWPESNDPRSVKAPQFRDPFAKSTLPVNDCFGEPNLGRANELKQKGCAIDILPDLHDFVGEVVDIYDKSPFDMDFLQAESSPVGCESVENQSPGGSKLGRKLSFDSSAFMNFPMVDDLNTNCGLEDNRELRPDNDYGGDNWGGNDFKPQQEQIRTGLFEKSVKNFRNFPMVDDSNTSCGLEDNRELRPDNDYGGVDYNWGSSEFNPQQEQIRTGLFEKSVKNFRASLSKEKFVPSLGETPLSKAVHSAQLQQGSPWTMEFLNRIKEKRRLRQQNQPWDTSAPPSGNQRNISKGTKRRSPSILEYYKYQGGTHDNTPRKLTPQRLQNQHGQLSNEKPSGLRPTWTPVDKRARRSLSYATSGAGGQTKLVWNENISHSQDSRFSN
ncbi:protein SHORTAGE IN CHIASMATA 1 [Silene latifolia]|uniref:protein SHORTAGE IN CHIASMATA 1 n=1 Tax=Silene latifolia TaxID=37657 RepID=UPI003D77D56D